MPSLFGYFSMRLMSTIFAFLFAFCGVAYSQAPGIITTIAGNGKAGFSGDGGLAIDASFASPASVCIDNDGNIFIADVENYRVRRIDKNGIITTVAGNGLQGPLIDGVPATEAGVMPISVCIDSQGNLYIADIMSGKIRRVGEDGIITTVAGNGNWVFNGDNIPATEAAISFPPFSGNSFFVDPDGNILIGDYLNGRIRHVDTDGIITTVAGGGKWEKGGFNDDKIPAIGADMSPVGVFANEDGEIFFSEDLFARIRRVDRDGIVTTIAGNGGRFFDPREDRPLEASIGHVTAICEDGNGDILFAVPPCHVVGRIKNDEELEILAGSAVCLPEAGGFDGDGFPANKALVNYPSGLCVDKYGNIYIADTGNNRVRRITGERPKAVHSEGKLSGSWGSAKHDHIISDLSAFSQNTQLFQNFPNPFNPDTWIPYELNRADNISVNIYDSNGRLVRSLSLGRKEAGIYDDKTHAAYWDSRNGQGEEATSGIYFYTLRTDSLESKPRKMILLE